jgi:hypothetical protein
MSKRRFLYAVLFFSVIALFSAYFLITQEGFEDQQTPLETQLNEAMTFFSEVLCPTHTILLEDAMTGKEGSNTEKRISAELEIQKTAGGPIFSCPPPNNPVQIPADIATRIQRTLDFFSKRLQELKKNITVSLNQCPRITDGFTNLEVCPPPPGQTTTPPDLKSLNPAGCKQIRQLDITTRQEILKARYNAVSTLVNDPKIATELAQIKADSDELLELKRKAEKGELMPNCPQI